VAKIQVDHFSDVLCIWAYVSHIRIAELQSEFGDDIAIEVHFFPVFGDVPGKIKKAWGDRGGIAAYSQHVQDVAEPFEHITLHEDVWLKNTPQSSLPVHLFLAAARLAEQQERTEVGVFSRYMTLVREAFFVHARDVAQYKTLLLLADEAGLPVDIVRQSVESGEAHAIICRDMYKAVELGIKSSPTLLFNEGRQQLAGNVGYRIIEANVRELLDNPAGQQSWC